MLHESDVVMIWRRLFSEQSLTREKLAEAETLLDGLSSENPLRLRLTRELEEIRALRQKDQSARDTQLTTEKSTAMAKSGNTAAKRSREFEKKRRAEDKRARRSTKKERDDTQLVPVSPPRQGIEGENSHDSVQNMPKSLFVQVEASGAIGAL
jgi:hypothetical protein